MRRDGRWDGAYRDPPMPVWLRAVVIAAVLALVALCGVVAMSGCAWRYDDGASSGLQVSGETVLPCGVNPCQPEVGP